MKSRTSRHCLNHGRTNQLSGAFWTSQAEYFKFFTPHPAIVGEELFEFVREFLAKIIDRFDAGKTVSIFFYRNDAIVAFSAFLVVLLPFNRSDDPAQKHAT